MSSRKKMETMKTASNRRKAVPPGQRGLRIAKIRWLIQNRRSLRRYPVRVIVAIMKEKRLFSQNSYWYDCQGLICSVLGREMEPQGTKYFDMRVARCRQCGKTERMHCQMDEPGVDHPSGCGKYHHEFKGDV